MIAYGGDINNQDAVGDTPLLAASNAGVFALLLDSGADIAINNFDGDTPLHTAAKLNNAATVETLLECGIAVYVSNSAGQTSPRSATSNNSSVETVKLLLGRGAYINGNIGTYSLDAAA